MKLTQSIIVLEALLTTDPQFPPEDRRKAVALGIEALKRIRKGRCPDRIYVCYLLPGETAE